jgi:hypothetical protein
MINQGKLLTKHKVCGLLRANLGCSILKSKYLFIAIS